MDIVTVNANSKLVQIASSIGRSPQSWRGWKSLYINMQTLEDSVQQDCLFWVKSFVSSYLKGMSGRLFFTQNGSIHIICKGVQDDVLHQAGTEICDLAYNESKVQIIYKIFDLQNDGPDYARYVVENYTNFTSEIPTHLRAFVDNIDVDAFNCVLHKSDASAEDTVSKVNSLKKIMLVEDDPVTRWMVRNTLKDTCDFIAAGNAHKAFNIYSTQNPDLVFLDINLPDESGYTVLEWILRNDPGANVVMFSSNDHIDNITQAIDVGAKGFIAKPFIKQQIFDYIDFYASDTRH